MEFATGKKHGKAVHAIGIPRERQLGRSGFMKRAVVFPYLQRSSTCQSGLSGIRTWEIGGNITRMKAIRTPGFSLPAGNTKRSSVHPSAAQGDEHQESHENIGHCDGKIQYSTVYNLYCFPRPLTDRTSAPRPVTVSIPPMPLPCLHQVCSNTPTH